MQKFVIFTADGSIYLLNLRCNTRNRRYFDYCKSDRLFLFTKSPNSKVIVRSKVPLIVGVLCLGFCSGKCVNK